MSSNSTRFDCESQVPTDMHDEILKVTKSFRFFCFKLVGWLIPDAKKIEGLSFMLIIIIEKAFTNHTQRMFHTPKSA